MKKIITYFLQILLILYPFFLICPSMLTRAGRELEGRLRSYYVVAAILRTPHDSH